MQYHRSMMRCPHFPKLKFLHHCLMSWNGAPFKTVSRSDQIKFGINCVYVTKVHVTFQPFIACSDVFCWAIVTSKRCRSKWQSPASEENENEAKNGKEIHPQESQKVLGYRGSRAWKHVFANTWDRSIQRRGSRLEWTVHVEGEIKYEMGEINHLEGEIKYQMGEINH